VFEDPNQVLPAKGLLLVNELGEKLAALVYKGFLLRFDHGNELVDNRSELR
jgi:hypothetical protein